MAKIQDTTTPLADRIDQLEQSLKAYNRDTRKALRARLEMLGLHQRAKLKTTLTKLAVITHISGRREFVKEKFLYDSLRANLSKKNGDITGVSVSFARHGIFLERGVGKNRPLGSAAANRLSAEKEWLYTILSERIEVLADLLEKEYGDIAVEQIRLLIPGIIDITIK